MGVRAYFDYTKQQYEEKVGASVAEDLKNLHSNEDEALNSYKVVDKAKGVVRIPDSACDGADCEGIGRRKTESTRRKVIR